MKKSYSTPMVLVQNFRLNENIAACEFVVTEEELEMMPNFSDSESGCSVSCSYMAVDLWLGTLLS